MPLDLPVMKNDKRPDEVTWRNSWAKQLILVMWQCLKSNVELCGSQDQLLTTLSTISCTLTRSCLKQNKCSQMGPKDLDALWHNWSLTWRKYTQTGNFWLTADLNIPIATSRLTSGNADSICPRADTTMSADPTRLHHPDRPTSWHLDYVPEGWFE